MERTKKKLVIRTIRGSAPRPGSNIPGDILINSTDEKLNWFSRREWRNNLVGAGLTGEEPYLAFIGQAITYEEVVVTQADIDAATTAGLEGVEIMLQGRKVTYKKPGVHNVNLTFDFANVDLDKLISAAKLGSEVYTLREKVQSRVNNGSVPRRAPVTTTEDEIVEDIIEPEDKEAEMPEILKGIKTDVAGNHTNADNSPLSPEQEAAMKDWMAAKLLHKEAAGS